MKKYDILKLFPKFSKTNLISLVIIIYNVCGIVNAQDIRGVTVNHADSFVTIYEKFQIQVDTIFDRRNAVYYPSSRGNASERLYNSDTIEVWASFTSPTGKVYNTPGFYNIGYKMNTGGMCVASDTSNIIADNTMNEWQVRFSPNEEGLWLWEFYVIDSGVLRTQRVNGSFTCVTKAGKKGFVKQQDARYLQYDNGEPFIPVGQNQYAPSDKQMRQQYCYYKPLIDSMVVGGQNNWRVFIGTGTDNWTVTGIFSTWYNLQTPVMNLNNYMDPKTGFDLDTLMAYCQAKDLYFVVAMLQGWQSIIRPKDPFAGGNYMMNHLADTIIMATRDYNNLINWADTFINPNGIHQPAEMYRMTNHWATRMMKDYVRYVAARYGYMRTLWAWEVYAEWERALESVDRWDTLYNGQYRYWDLPDKAEMATFIDSMYTWVKRYDPYKRIAYASPNDNHLIGAVGSPSIDADTAFNRITAFEDMISSHEYTWTDLDSNKLKLTSELFYETGARYTKVFPNKPYFISEGGWPNGYDSYKRCDSLGFDQHAGLYTSLFCGAVGTQTFWDFWQVTRFHWYTLFGPVKNFTEQSHMKLSSNFKNVYQYPPNNTNGYTMAYTISNGARGDIFATDTMYGWIVDTSYLTTNLYKNHKSYLLTLNPANKPYHIISLNYSIPVPSANVWYHIEFYNSETGNYYSDTFTQSINGTPGNYILPFRLPYLLYGKYGDALFRITKKICYVTSGTYTLPPGTTTWNTPMQLHQNVVIPPRSTLVISSHVTLPGGMSISVQQNTNANDTGGILILGNGGVIDAADCYDSQWLGIITTGKSGAPYDKPCHGRVYLQEGSILKDAITGVESVNGGVVQAYRTFFSNCSTALKIDSFIDPLNPWRNLSLIRECTFEWTEQRHHSPPNSYGNMVSLDKVRNIEFDGCYFYNNDPTVFSNTQHRGTAIYSSDCPVTFASGGSVSNLDSCIMHTGNRGIIKGFSNGIKAVNTQLTDRWLNVNSYNFMDNLNDIYIKKGQSLKVSECQFSYWKQTAHFNDTNYNEGIITDSCGGVRLWHNGFRFSCDTCCYIDVAYSGANTDRSMIHGNVFRDTANNMKYIVGNRFRGNNDYMGITCNAYRGMMIDWLIDSNATLLTPQGYFGDVNKSAKNSFDTFDLTICPTCYHIKKLNGSAIYCNYSPIDVGHIAYPNPYNNQQAIATSLGDPTPCDTLNCGGWLSAINEPTNMLDGGCWIWPNPAQDELNIYIAEANQNRRIFVYDMQGRELLQKTIIRGVNYTTIDLSSIPQGIYFYNVRSEKGQGFNGKLVIIKP